MQTYKWGVRSSWYEQRPASYPSPSKCADKSAVDSEPWKPWSEVPRYWRETRVWFISPKWYSERLFRFFITVNFITGQVWGSLSVAFAAMVRSSFPSPFPRSWYQPTDTYPPPWRVHPHSRTHLVISPADRPNSRNHLLPNHRPARVRLHRNPRRKLPRFSSPPNLADARVCVWSRFSPIPSSQSSAGSLHERAGNHPHGGFAVSKGGCIIFHGNFLAWLSQP